MVARSEIRKLRDALPEWLTAATVASLFGFPVNDVFKRSERGQLPMHECRPEFPDCVVWPREAVLDVLRRQKAADVPEPRKQLIFDGERVVGGVR
jgi:DNA-binding XRE family transcriptional regulator